MFLDPIGLCSIVLLKPTIAFARQVLRRVHDPEGIDINEVFHFGIRDGIGGRRASFEQLRQGGVLGLDVEAGQLSPSLVERYLELKERALL